MQPMEISVTKLVPAPAEEVFDAWLDRGKPGGPWFGARGRTLNPVVGGLYWLEVEHAGRKWAHYGRFLAIERPKRIEHTWMSEGTRGLETVVVLTFEPLGDSTEVTLRHSGLADEEMGKGHQEGWTWCLSMLAQRFGAAPGESA